MDPETIGMPLVVVGDPPDKEGVIAVEFLIGTNKHYGYIHFDFRKELGWYNGCGGYILGWAYETEPDKPINAAPIAVPPTPFTCELQGPDGGLFDLIWRATPGATYQIQGSPTVSGPFTDFTPDFIIRAGVNAAPVVEILRFGAPVGAPGYFWRVARVR